MDFQVPGELLTSSTGALCWPLLVFYTRVSPFEEQIFPRMRNRNGHRKSIAISLGLPLCILKNFRLPLAAEESRQRDVVSATSVFVLCKWNDQRRRPGILIDPATRTSNVDLYRNPGNMLIIEYLHFIIWSTGSVFYSSKKLIRENLIDNCSLNSRQLKCNIGPQTFKVLFFRGWFVQSIVHVRSP